MARLNGSGQKIGPSIVLKVMSGDIIDLAVKSYYKSQTTGGDNSDILTDILTSLAGGIVSVAGESHGSSSLLSNSSTSPLLGALDLFLSNNNPDVTGKPKAYLNWILLDERFNYVSSYPQSGALSVGSADALNTLAYTGINITKNGYLYIYVSNETQGWDVFFDNLSIKHYTGPILEETHYYPFGLAMAGISSKAMGKMENRFKFNDGTELENKEFSDGSGLEWYATQFRSLDPQLGRFWQTDPLAQALVSLSPYQFANNNPIYFNDPLGLLSDSLHPVVLPTVTVTAKKGDNTTPWQLGMEWLTGKGPRAHHFKDKDLFTQMLRKHEHVNDTRNIVIDSIQGGARGRITGTNGYSLSGIGGVGKYIRDYSTLLTGGLTGNLAVTYLGSYELKYEVLSIDEQTGTAVVHFYVKNSSTAASGFRPPVIGYTETWKNTVGKQINKTFSSGPMSKTTQTVEWTETIQWKGGDK